MDNAPTTRGRGKPPVSAHPAFPAVVALWFAALLGIGSLILPVRLYEAILAATGISNIITAAAPPLGFTARALIALVATVCGAGLGLYAARRIGGKSGDGVKSSKFGIFRRDDSSRRAFSAADEIGEDGIEDEEDDLPPLRESVIPAGRRRALAMVEDDGPSELLNAAPLPGEGTDSLAGLGGAVMHADDALELFEEIEPDDYADLPRQEFVADAHAWPQDGGAQDDTEAPLELDMIAEAPARSEHSSGQLSDPLPFSPPSLARKDVAPEEGGPDGATVSALAGPGFLNPRSPRLFDPSQAIAPAPQTAPKTGAPEEAAAPDFSEDIVPDKPFTPSDAFSEPLAANPFSAPSRSEAGAANDGAEGLVQLVQKLGSTLEKHREWSAQRAAQGMAAKMAAPAPQFSAEQPVAHAEAKLADEFDPAAADDAAEAMAAYFGKPATVSEQHDGANEAASEPDTRPFAAPKQVFQPAEEEAEVRDQMHPAPPAPVAGEAYAPFTGFAASANMSFNAASEDEDEDVADLAASFQLPIAAKPAPAPVEIEQAETDAAAQSPRPAFDVPPPSARPAAPAESTRDADYSAVAAHNPFKSNTEDFVRIDEPEPDTAEPAVVFPNQQRRAGGLGLTPSAFAGEYASPARAASASNPSVSNDDNERALREALMNLQRMGK